MHKLSVLLIPLMSMAVLAACDSGPSAAEIEKMVQTKVQTKVQTEVEAATAELKLALVEYQGPPALVDHKDLRVKLGLPGRMDHKDLRVKLGLPDRMDHKDLQEKYFTQIFRRTQSVRGRSKPRRGMSSQYWSPLWEARPHYSNPSLA